MAKFALIGGPLDGKAVEAEHRPSSLLLFGDGIPDGKAARYRPTRAPGALRFRGLEEVVGTLPLPQKGNDADD